MPARATAPRCSLAGPDGAAAGVPIGQFQPTCSRKQTQFKQQRKRGCSIDRSVLTSFSVNDGTRLIVTHGPSTRTRDLGEGMILLQARGCEPNTLTRIRVDAPTFERHVFLHWHHRDASPPLGLFLAPRGDVLLVGGGTISASISLSEPRVLHENAVVHFWGFQRRRNAILELGEQECRLYDLDGNLTGCAPVEPPYDLKETDAGIELHSDDAETRILTWPEGGK